MNKYDSRCFWFSEQSMGNPGTVPVCGMYDTVENFSCENCKSYIGKATARDLIKRKLNPVTNYDRLISKTPEELAEWISERIDCCVCKSTHNTEEDECPCRPHQACVDFWLDWLKQEAADEK